MLAECGVCKVIYANHNSFKELCGICQIKIHGYRYGWGNTSEITTKTLHHTGCWENHCVGFDSSNYTKTYRPESLAHIAFSAVDYYRLHLPTDSEQHFYKRMEKLYRWRICSEYINRECPKLVNH